MDAPAAASSARKSSTRVVLPMPGSPVTPQDPAAAGRGRLERPAQRRALRLPPDGRARRRGSPGPPRPRARRRPQARQLAVDLRGRRPALPGSFSSIVRSGPPARAGISGFSRSGGSGCFVHDGATSCRARVGPERVSAGGQLVQDDAQREDVGGPCRPARPGPARATCSDACRAACPGR